MGILTGDRELCVVLKRLTQHPGIIQSPASVTFRLCLTACVVPPVEIGALVYVTARALTWTPPSSYVHWEILPSSTMTIARAVLHGLQVLVTGEYEITCCAGGGVVLTLDDAVVIANAASTYKYQGSGRETLVVRRYDCLSVAQGSILRVFLQSRSDPLPREHTELVIRRLHVGLERVDYSPHNSF